MLNDKSQFLRAGPSGAAEPQIAGHPRDINKAVAERPRACVKSISLTGTRSRPPTGPFRMGRVTHLQPKRDTGRPKRGNARVEQLLLNVSKDEPAGIKPRFVRTSGPRARGSTG